MNTKLIIQSLVIIFYTIEIFSADTLLIIEEGGYRKGSKFITYFTNKTLSVEHRYHISDSTFSYQRKNTFLDRVHINKMLKFANQISEKEFKAQGIMDGGYIKIKIEGSEIECINCLTDLNRNTKHLNKSKLKDLKKIRKVYQLFKDMTKKIRKESKRNYCKNPLDEDKNWCTEEWAQ